MIELRLLKYFLEVAAEENFTRAAENLHLTQPTLSRQIAGLEAELGRKLYVRESYGIRLTEEGRLFRKRAQEIIDLEEKAIAELAGSSITGTVYIGAGETAGVKHISRVLRELRGEFPGIRYRMISGDAEDLTDKLARSLIDFGLFVGKISLKDCECITLPEADRWGILIKRDDELAGKKFIVPEDLRGRKLLFSHQAKSHGEFSEWLGYSVDELDIIGTHNLAFNASVMVREGLGILITIEGIVNTSGKNGLKFIPLRPEIRAGLVLAWKKGAVLSKAAQKFLESFKASILPNHQE